MRCKIKVIKGLEGVWTQYQPVVGAVYDAEFVPGSSGNAREVAIIDIAGKKILLRWREFEIVG